MKAEDTVISQKEVQDIISQRMPMLLKATVSGGEYPAMWHREIQAEISYKAGEESEKAHWIGEIERQVKEAHSAGMRIVVEWVEEHKFEEDTNRYAFSLWADKWQTFKKERGL